MNILTSQTPPPRLSAKAFTERLQQVHEGDQSPHGPVDARQAEKANKLGAQLQTHLDDVNDRYAPLESADELVTNVEETSAHRLILARNERFADSDKSTALVVGLSVGLGIASGFAICSLLGAPLGSVGAGGLIGATIGAVTVPTMIVALDAKQKAVFDYRKAQSELPGPSFITPYTDVWYGQGEYHRDAVTSYRDEAKQWAQFLQAPTTLAQF